MKPEVVVIPAKGIATGKSRLMHDLPAPAREQLNAAQLTTTLRAARAAFGATRTYVVSACSQVLSLAAREGAVCLAEKGPPGLNEALEQARAELRDQVHAITVLPVDLPEVSPACLRAVLQACGPDEALLVPDRAGQGTNVLRLPMACALSFSFGLHSFARHRQQLEQAGWPHVVVLDTPLRDDLDEACHLQLHASALERLSG